jgi:cytochrome c oxidase assembly protein subunit 11
VTEPKPDKGKFKTALILSLLGLGMFGLSFAMVPLYNLFCQVTGIQSVSVRSSVQPAEQQTSIPSDDRLITIKFDATVHPNLPWVFQPVKSHLRVSPGQMYTVNFVAQNNSNRSVSAQAIPSVIPWQATEFLSKLECFCFNRQTLTGGEKVNMPLRFRLSPDLPADIKTLTLSYSLMRLDSDNDVPTARPQEI